MNSRLTSIYREYRLVAEFTFEEIKFSFKKVEQSSLGDE